MAKKTRMTTPLSPSRSDAPTRPSTAGGTIFDVKLGHIVAALGRYRPVLAVLAAIVLLAVVLEGPAVIGGGAEGFAASNRTNLGSGPTATSTTTTAPPQDSFSAPAPLGAGTSPRRAETASPPTTTRPASTYSPPPRSSSGSGSGSGTGTGSSGAVEEDEALTVVAAAWASQTAGTPIAGAGVPDDSLPVGTRLGRHDKRSFIRLSGDEVSLTLLPVDDEGAHRRPEEAVIQACQIEDAGWEEAEGMSFDDAPAYDAENCVDGVRGDDGSWTFNFLVYPQRADDRGFALVPGPDAPLDFQVAFAR